MYAAVAIPRHYRWAIQAVRTGGPLRHHFCRACRGYNERTGKSRACQGWNWTRSLIGHISNSGTMKDAGHGSAYPCLDPTMPDGTACTTFPRTDVSLIFAFYAESVAWERKIPQAVFVAFFRFSQKFDGSGKREGEKFGLMPFGLPGDWKKSERCRLFNHGDTSVAKS